AGASHQPPESTDGRAVEAIESITGPQRLRMIAVVPALQDLVDGAAEHRGRKDEMGIGNARNVALEMRSSRVIVRGKNQKEPASRAQGAIGFLQSLKRIGNVLHHIV